MVKPRNALHHAIVTSLWRVLSHSHYANLFWAYSDAAALINLEYGLSGDMKLNWRHIRSVVMALGVVVTGNSEIKSRIQYSDSWTSPNLRRCAGINKPIVTNEKVVGSASKVVIGWTDRNVAECGVGNFNNLKRQRLRLREEETRELKALLGGNASSGGGSNSDGGSSGGGTSDSGDSSGAATAGLPPRGGQITPPPPGSNDGNGQKKRKYEEEAVMKVDMPGVGKIHIPMNTVPQELIRILATKRTVVKAAKQMDRPRSTERSFVLSLQFANVSTMRLATGIH
mmetsp:Transcript_7442/g.16575  ORF Transcript_7442/g.16575 Transcript_7442/m.16575 type:complete len:284 (+) Transcript_7442:256-1107(+)